MSTRVLVFDVNETLSDLSPLAARFVAVGAPASASRLWFSSLLRDGFALGMTGANPDFADLARETLAAQLSVTSIDRPLEEAVRHVLDGLPELPVHPDVPDGVRALAEAGHRLVTLSNGGTQVAERLLTGAGLREHFERLLSVQDAPAWKPASGAYEYAARECGVPVEEAVLVACHPWDIDGAAKAGMRTAWIDRSAGYYPTAFSSPTYTVTGIDALLEELE